MFTVDTRKLNIAIANAQYSITELSVISGVSRTAMHRFKAGTQKARPKTIGKLARALGVKVEDLI